MALEPWLGVVVLVATALGATAGRSATRRRRRTAPPPVEAEAAGTVAPCAVAQVISCACEGIAKIAAGYYRWSLARAIIRGRLAEPNAAQRSYRLALYSALRDEAGDDRKHISEHRSNRRRR